MITCFFAFGAAHTTVCVAAHAAAKGIGREYVLLLMPVMATIWMGFFSQEGWWALLGIPGLYLGLAAGLQRVQAAADYLSDVEHKHFRLYSFVGNTWPERPADFKPKEDVRKEITPIRLLVLRFRGVAALNIIAGWLAYLNWRHGFDIAVFFFMCLLMGLVNQHFCSKIHRYMRVKKCLIPTC